MAISDLIEQTIAQHIIAPKVLSYAPSKLNEVTGRFVSANRVYNFVLNKDGVSYSPAGQNDSLLFSALYLRQDAVRKPKVGNDKCNAGKSYQCGKICLGNRRKCHKGVRDVNDARRIASILESTNRGLESKVVGDVSDKAISRGRALFEARGARFKNGKAEIVNPNDADALRRLGLLEAMVEGDDIKTTEKTYGQSYRESYVRRKEKIKDRQDWLKENLDKKKYSSDNPPKRGDTVYYAMDFGELRLPSQIVKDSYAIIKGTVLGVSKDGSTVSIKRLDKGENEGRVTKAPTWQLFKNLDSQTIALEYEDLANYEAYGTRIPERNSRLIDKAVYKKMTEDDYITQTAKLRIKPINPSNVSSILNTINSPTTDEQTRREYIEILKESLPKIRAGKKFQRYGSASKIEETIKQYA